MNNVGMKNTSAVDMLLRTDSADEDTEDTLAPSAMEVISSPLPSVMAGRTTRFRENDVILYFKMSSGTGTMVATFLR
jgi:hypothetical protein